MNQPSNLPWVNLFYQSAHLTKASVVDYGPYFSAARSRALQALQLHSNTTTTKKKGRYVPYLREENLLLYEQLWLAS